MLLRCLSVLLVLATDVQAQSCVILLHGLARTSASMDKMAAHLEGVGYQVVNHDYPSRKFNVETLAENEVSAGISKCSTEVQINFVTHSLGGILVRQYLTTHQLPKLHRVVMLGPPNHGSQVVDRLKNAPGFKLLNGPAGAQLGTDELSIPSKLGSANFQLGVIAGTSTINLILSTMLPNPDDGKVSVQSTKLAGMADHISLPVSHPFLMKNKKVIEEVENFLRDGYFSSSDKNKAQLKRAPEPLNANEQISAEE